MRLVGSESELLVNEERQIGLLNDLKMNGTIPGQKVSHRRLRWLQVVPLCDIDSLTNVRLRPSAVYVPRTTLVWLRRTSGEVWMKTG